MVPGHGPRDARIVIVGEAPGREEESRGIPFCGASGMELTRMLNEVGIDRNLCYITNVCLDRPPGNEIDEWFYTKAEAQKRGLGPMHRRYPDPRIVEGVRQLYKDLDEIRPELILAFGDTALWALTGESGITKWRGSRMWYRGESWAAKVMPTIHPALILRQWQWRFVALHDLRVARRDPEVSWLKPDYDFLVRPAFGDVMRVLDWLENDYADASRPPLAVDIETRLGHIACIGLAWSPTQAICIPLMCTERQTGYWSLAEEQEIVVRLRGVLTNPRISVVGQNFLYDSQYIAKWWGFIPNVTDDTMLAHHSCFPGDMPKGLDFLSSLYCRYHYYWKDEGKDWDPSMDEEQLWTYNCKDAVTTFEVNHSLQNTIDQMGLREVYQFQMDMFLPVLTTMLRGVRHDRSRTGEFVLDLQDQIARYEEWFTRVMPEGLIPKGKTPYYRSTQKLAHFFYNVLKLQPVFNRKTKGPSTDDDALTTLMRREPLISPLCKAILDYRSLGVFYKTFLSPRTDNDKRMRSSYNLAGTETFRLSSSKDAFGSGMNLQNIPRMEE